MTRIRLDGLTCSPVLFTSGMTLGDAGLGPVVDWDAGRLGYLVWIGTQMDSDGDVI